MKTRNAGATPKFTKSARLSSSAPKRDDAFSSARDAAVDAVEQGGEHDRRQRQLVAPLDPHADRGEAGAEPEQGEEVRHQHAHGHARVPEQRPAAAALRFLFESSAGRDP